MEPAAKRTVEIAGVGKTQQVSGFQQGHARLRQVLFGQFAAGVVKQGLEAGALLLQPPLQGALRQVQGLGQGFALGLALRQDAAQYLAHPVGDPAFRETRQVFAGKTVMQYRHGFIGGGQRCLHVGALEHQRIVRRTEHQRRMERHLVGFDILWLRPLHQHPARLHRATAQPAAQRQRTGQRCFGAVPGRWQVVAVYGQDQRIALGAEDEAEVGAFGNDALVTHQALEAFGQGAAGHQRITHHMERCRAHHPRHVQAYGLVARQLYRQLPQPGHGVLGEARPAVQPFQFECLHDP